MITETGSHTTLTLTSAESKDLAFLLDVTADSAYYKRLTSEMKDLRTKLLAVLNS